MPLEDRQLQRYHLRHLLGSGCHGEVYLAEHAQTREEVTVKVVPLEKSAPEDQQRFQREMQVVKQLHHKHILPVFDYGIEQKEHTTWAYVVMPSVREGSLLDWLSAHSSALPLPAARVAQIVLQAASALNYAHRRQRVHGALNCSNVLVRSGSQTAWDILLTDFASLPLSHMSASQDGWGTPAFLPPEQWEAEPVPASDQYALAILAFHLLTGAFPFCGSLEEVRQGHTSEQPPAPSLFNQCLGPQIDTVLLRALAKGPQERFPSLLLFAHALQQALHQERVDLASSLSLQLSGAASDAPSAGSTSGIASRGDIAGQQQAVSHLTLATEAQAPTNQSSPASATSLASATPAHPPSESAQERSQQTPLLIRPELLNSWRGLSFLPLNVQRLLVLVLALLVLLGGSGLLLAQMTSHSPPRASLRTIPESRASSTPANRGATATALDVNATATIANDPYLNGKGTLLLNDPLNAPNHWKVHTTGAGGGLCSFKNGAYTAEQVLGPHREIRCSPDGLQASNFIFEVQMSLLQGDCGGLVFRSNGLQHTGYTFSVCADGSTSLWLTLVGGHRVKLFGSPSSALRQGYTQTNVLAVTANGNTLSLYINKQKVGSVIEDTFSQGSFALLAEDELHPTEVAFRDARIWQLSRL